MHEIRTGLLYINGKWEKAAGGDWLTVYDPATGESVGRVPNGGREDAGRAIAAAAAAFPVWRNWTGKDRSERLLTIYRLLLEHREELARTITLEQGKPLAEARTEVDYGAEFFSWYAGEARRIYGETIPASAPDKRLLVIRQPVGVVAAISPWNFPLATITKKVAAALAAGCTVVVKPAEQTPLTAVALFELMERAGLPPGVANLVTGDPEPIGQEFLENPGVRQITFTGSTAVGKMLMRGAAAQLKKVSLELGGHAPFIIFADADLEQAAEDALACKFRAAGQTCTCTNRVYVERSVVDRFAQMLVQKVRQLRVGYGLEEGVQIGPLINEQGYQKVTGHVADALAKGAEVLTGGERLQGEAYARGYFFAPTVLLGATPEMRIMQEETFGPVLPLIPFDTEEEVYAAANATPYGLGAYLYTRDLGRAIRGAEALEYGVVGLNDPFPAVPQAPFGGVKESGLGKEGGRQGLEEFLETKYISLKIPR